MPFFNNPNIGNLNNVQPLVEEEEKKSSTFLTSPPIKEPIEQPEPQPFGFLSSTPVQTESKTIPQSLGYDYNIADFRNNKEVQEAWERFYDSAELNNYDNDVVEYLRDAEYSVTSVGLRSQQIKNWGEQTRKDYTTLQRAFQKANGLGNAQERFKFAGNLAVDILGDPLNWAGVAFAIPTMGGSLTVNTAAQALLRTGLNRSVKSKLKKEAIKNTGSIALYGTAEGVTWGGAYEFFSQEADKEIGIQQGPTDWKKVGQVAALGGAFGALVPGAIGGISNSLFLRKLYNFSNEDNIYSQAAKLAIDSEKVIDVNMSDPSTKIVFFKNQKGSKGRQKKGSQLEIVPLTRRTYKQYILPQAKAVGKETFEEVNSFQKFLKFNDVIEDNAFLVIRHGKNKAGRITKQVEPMTEMNGRLSAVSKEYLEEYFNVPTRRQYWKQVRSFRDKDAITHTQIDDQSVEGLLYARQAGISEKEIAARAAKYGIDIEDVDAAGYKQFKEMVQDNANLDATDVKLSYLEQLISGTIGKATTKYLKLAKNNDALVEYLESLVPGATNQLFKRRKTGVNEFSYGENKGNSDGFYLTNLEIALNRSGKTGIHAMITPEENDQLLALIMSGGKVKTYGGKKISQTSKTAYFGDGKNIMGIKKLLKHAFDEGDESGLFAFTGQVKNYFPQKLQHSKIEADRLGFEDTIIRAGHADPINDVVPTKFFNSKGDLIDGFDIKSMPKDKEIWGRDFLAEAGENLDKARELKAAAIVDDMIERRWTPYTDNALQGIPDIIKGGHSFMKHRVFDKVPHVEMLPYIETDVAKVLQDYFVNFSQANVRTKMYGKNVPAMYKDGGIFRRIEDEFLAKGGDRTQVRKVMDKLENLHKLVTGLDHNTIKNNAVRTVSDWGKLSQQMAHLPLATLSSLTEPLLLLSRARAGDVGNVVYDIGNAMKKQTVRTFDRMAQNSKRIKGETTRGLKEFDDEEWVEIYKTGLALEQATMDRIEGLTGEALSSGLAKNVQNAFFKTNLLTQWTSAVQLAAFTTGKRLIKQNAESLYLHNAGIKKLGKKKVQYLSDQLEELGIPLDQANDWYKKYLSKDGVFNVANANKDNFYKQRIVRGANRFTREIILNPSTSSANRPLWFSSPAGQLLMQFAGYPTVFNNTVLKRFVNEATVYPLQTTPKILATTMLMTSIAMLGNYIRSGGRNWEEQEPGELVFNSIRRWGGVGALEYFDKTSKNLELGSGQLGSILKAGGPLMGDAVDALIYRKGITEFATTNIPGYSALPKETRDYLKKIGRDRDKALVEFLLSVLGEETAAPFARGGIVDVPNAKDEPDEMINKFTGLPYNATSASVQDIEDRERRAEGSDGAEKRELPDSLKPLENLVNTIQGKVREVREGNKRLLESSKEILSSPSFRLYADAVIKRKKEPITNNWFSDQEYATIKESLKSVFKHPQRRLRFYESLKEQGKKRGVFQETFPLPRAYDESKNISKAADKVNMLFRWGYDGEITNEGKPISLYETLGTSTLKIPHKQPYNSAVLEIYDKYDFNSQHGGSGTYFEQAKNIVKNVLSGEAYRAESAAMQLAEKYGALVLPDDYTAAKENREPKFVPVNIQVPVSEVMDEDTWKSYQSSITYKEPEPTSTVMQERKFQDRKGFESGGGVSKIMQRLIERGGKAMGVGSSEQRANEKQAAAIVNQMVADGTIPKYEYVEVDAFGFRSGKTGDVFEAVNHGLLSATYGDSIFRRGALQAKEIGQGFSRPLDSKRDSYNNRVGFKIRETAKTPEEITREINNRIIRSYEKMNSGEALIPGEDFFLNPNEMEL
tara:strand:- start:54 stop:5468 length:5415 start_codon:yes stop_codon:yes gene_type:complete